MRVTKLLTAACAATLVMTVAACGADHFSAGTPMRSNEIGAVVDQIKQAGKPAYYLGSAYDNLPLNSLDLVEENAPAFQVEADYGTCSAPDGGCSAPVVVSTNDRTPDVQGLRCRRLDPQLGVPTGVVMGELTLVSGDLLVTVSEFRDRSGIDDMGPALRALKSLREVGTTSPVEVLPPPTPAASAWMDEVCGTSPGREVSHDLDTVGTLDNSHVPDFTIERLGGGELAWADYSSRPVVVAVGTGAQVTVLVRRLRPIVQRSSPHPVLLGLVTDPTGDKFNPRPVSEIEAEVGDLGVPVGYAAEPLSAVWFLDAASNRGIPTELDGGVVAFVDRSGSVAQFAPPSTSDDQLQEWVHALG